MKFILHRGLSFCDVSVIDDTGHDHGSARWLYSKHKFRAQVEGFLKDWAPKIKEIILLDEFADRLSGLRMGGSVAAIFPKGLEKLTQKCQASPIHSESMVFTAPDSWDDSSNWVTQTLAALQKDTVKRIAWQVDVPEKVLAPFAEAGFENFVAESLQPEMILNWRRNLLNASCSGPILELTEEIQSILQNLKIEASIQWVDEDLKVKSSVKNRYGLTSVWTHLISKWSQNLVQDKCDVFVLDWDGCFHIGSEENQRWTPWGWVATHPPLPNVKLFKTQPTTTLEKDTFGKWAWLGKADAFEPGPVFLGRGLKPTVLDVLVDRADLENQFDVKSDFEDKTQRLLSSLSGFKNPEQVNNFKDQISGSARSQWAQSMLEMSQTQTWIVLGSLSSTVEKEFKNLKNMKIQFQKKIPTLAELIKFTENTL